MIFIFLFFAGLGYVYYGTKKTQQPSTQSKGNERKLALQPISSQAAQGFAQGSPESPSFGKRWREGNRVIAVKQKKVKKGIAGNAGTDRIVADLKDRIAGTFDPQWKMRYMNAYHRMTLQQDIDNDQAPRAPLNVDRVSHEVNDDSGQASGFTRTQITYQDRFRRGRPRPGQGPNATRPLDQEDPGDQTAIQTTLMPNGFKSIIYPAHKQDKNGRHEPWAGLQVVNLERDYWSKNGRPYNQVGATQSDMPTHKGWMWGWIIPKRGKHGAYPSGKQLPGRSNRHNDSVNSGQGTG